MSDSKKSREDLLTQIANAEQQLYQAELESSAWNRGKYKQHSNAQISKIYVESIRKNLQKLRNELDSLDDENI